ncbi:MAG: hypothetical protein Q4A23_02850 [bacterium]|nr:hypothetical protein [bacterium]
MNIAVCLKLSFDERGAYKYQGIRYKQFQEALLLFNNEAIKKNGNPLYFVCINDLQKDGSFDKYYILNGQVDDRLRFEVVNKNIMPDVVFNRIKDSLYNHPYFASVPWSAYNSQSMAMLGNKSISLRNFSQYMPLSICVNGSDDINKIKDLIDGESRSVKWVMKPLRQNGGRGILLLDHNEAIKIIATSDQPFLLQEFCETRSVPELDVVGRHDVRVYVIDGQPLLLAIRQPKKGDFLANTAAGGSIRFLDIALLPYEAMTMIRDIITDINAIEKRYFISIDIFCTDSGWKLIEVNDQPGMPAVYQTSYANNIAKKLIDSLKEVYNDRYI